MSKEIVLTQEELKKEIEQAFIHGQSNAQMMEAGLERDETEDYVNSRMRVLLNQNKKKITKEEASRKIVEYFNQHQMVGGKWDSIMYTQKKFVMELLNQTKDE